MRFAICCDIFEFHANRLLDPVWASKFPGSGWVRLFAKECAELGWEAVSGDIALSHVQAGYWAADSVFVIQEMDSYFGRKLRGLGARPLLLTCCESPLYAGVFYDDLPALSQVFPEVMTPQFLMPGPLAGKPRRWPFRFPTYLESDPKHLHVPWDKRKDVVLIASNKYWSNKSEWPSVLHPRQFLVWAWQELRRKFSKSRLEAVRRQLHDQRFNLLLQLSSRDLVEVYGRGWEKLEHLPEGTVQGFKNYPLKLMGPVANKVDTLSQYKFAICYENVAIEGYLTEKLIDSLVAGTIPIYWGAPDVDTYVPPGCYVNAAHFDTVESLCERLASISSEEAQRMIDAGKGFLHSEAAAPHTYEGFSKWVIGLAIENEKQR